MQIKDLKQDKRNYRKHNERNLDLIKKSVDEVGLGRSIVIDSENEIVCGNGLVSQLDEKTPVKVIETDGSELVVVKRTDLKTEDEKRKKLAIMDNSTSDSSEFDIELLKEDFLIPELTDLGIDVADVDIYDNIEDDYSQQNEQEKGFRITYELVFNDENEQEQWYKFLQAVKRKYPDIETISERLLVVTNKWIQENE